VNDSLSYAGNLKVLSHSDFEAGCMKRKHSETGILYTEKKRNETPKKLKKIQQNTMEKTEA